MGLDETSEGFSLGELVVAVCMWDGGGEKGTHKNTIKFYAPTDDCSHAISQLFQYLPCDLG